MCCAPTRESPPRLTEVNSDKTDNTIFRGERPLLLYDAPDSILMGLIAGKGSAGSSFTGNVTTFDGMFESLHTHAKHLRSLFLNVFWATPLTAAFLGKPSRARQAAPASEKAREPRKGHASPPPLQKMVISQNLLENDSFRKPFLIAASQNVSAKSRHIFVTAG